MHTMRDHEFVHLHDSSGDIECQHCRVRLSGCTDRDFAMLNEPERNSCYGSPEAERAAMERAMKMRR